MNILQKQIVIFLASAFCVVFVLAQETKDSTISSGNYLSDFDTFFRNILSTQKYVGLGACLVKNEKIIWEGYYGFSNLEEKTQLGRENIFPLMSLSKTVTTFALMQLYEKGLFDLDDDINNYISIKVRNPNFPDMPITFRMLLTHTASFEDVLSTGLKIPQNVPRPQSSLGDSEMTLEEYIREILSPEGRFYSTDYYSQNKPGIKYSYSNIAFSLLGYLVEKIAKKDFSEYCKEEIFHPLEMKNTSWHLRGLDTSRVIFGYSFSPDDSIPNYRKAKHFGEPGYPAGMLRTDMDDYIKFINVIINEGRYEDKQLLKPETIRTMLTPQNITNIPSRAFKTIDISLCWLISKIENAVLYNMNGFSVSFFMNTYFSKKDKSAIIYYFSGINMKNMEAVTEITKKLYHALESFK
jgi:CubicO group peptidase (beta-lactamase class C family)